MATAKTRKPTARKRTVRKKKKPSGFSGRIPIARIVLFLALIALLFLSIGAAGYVIFFRVVVASAVHDRGGRAAVSMAVTHTPMQTAARRMPDYVADSA